MRLQQQARDLFPYLQPLIEPMLRRNGSGGSGGSSSTPASGVPNPHALNSPYHTGTLADSQAPQFLKRDGSRSLTGNLSVGSGITIDGVDISVFKSAYDSHVLDPDAHHDHATAGTGITVSGSQVVSVDQAFSPTWTGTHQFNAAPQIHADLAFVGADRTITSPAGIDVTWDLGGDLILDSANTYRSGDYADGIPIAGFSLFVNSGGDRQLTINTIKSDSLHTRVFVADMVRIDMGEEYWGKSMGILYQDFTSPASIGGTATIVFEDAPLITGQLFTVNDWILIRYINRGVGLDYGSIWGQVSSYTDLGNDSEGRGHQSWTFTLRHGDTSIVVKKGNVAVDFGASGQGYIHLSTLQDADGPWFRIGDWSGSDPFTAGNNHILTQIGNLDGISDTALNPSGYGLYSDNAYLHGVVRTAQTIMDDSGINFDIQDLDGTIITSTADLSRVAWWDDVVAQTGLRMDISGYVDSSGFLEPLKTFNRFDVRVGTTAVDAALIGLTAGSGAAINLDSRGTIRLAATTVNVQADFDPLIDITYNLGSASFRWATLYVDNVNISGSLSAGSMGGATWTYAGSMVIDATGAGTRTVSVTNSGAGSANLDVDQNITLGGTVDGVDVAALGAAYAAHITNADAHHDHATSGTGISITGQVVSVDGTVVINTRSISTSGALAGGGNLSADRTLSLTLAASNPGLSQASGLTVDGTVVRTARAIATSGALAGGGDLSADRTLSLTLAASSPGLSQASGLTVDSSVVRTSRSISTSGALAGGGDLSANRTLALTLATTSGLNQTSGLAVGAGTGITVNTSDVAVNQAFAPTWTGAHIWSNGATFNGGIVFNHDISITGARTITTDSTNNLTLSPGGDLVLDPTGIITLPNAQEMKTTAFTDAPTGIVGMRFWDRGSNYRQLTIGAMKMDELYARAFVSDEVRLDRGEEFWAKSYGVVETDFSLPAVSSNVNVWFEDAPGLGALPLFHAGDYILIRTIDWTTSLSVVKVWLLVIDGDGAGTNDWISHDATNYRQQWTLQRLSGGTTSQVIKKGVTALDAGVTGQGQIYLSALTSAGGPFIETGAFTSTASSIPVFTYYTRMGNLNGSVDYVSDTYGFVAGNNIANGVSTFSGAAIDATNGMRLFNTNSQWRNGGNTYTMGVTGGNVKISASATLGSADVMTISPTGTLFNQDISVVGAIKPGVGGIDFSLAAGVTGSLLAESGSDGIYLSAGSLRLASGNINVTGRVRATTGFNSYNQTINDDSVLDIAITTQGLIFVTVGSGGSINTRYLFAAFRSNSTPIMQSISAGADVNTSTSTLTGTTGTDVKMTVSATSGHIYIENRLGSAITFTVTLMAAL